MFKFITILISTLLISMPLSHSKELLIVYPSDQSLQPGMKLYQKVIKELYKRLNIKIKFKNVHATRSLMMSNSGKADGELIRTKIIEKKFKNLIRVNLPIDKIRFWALTLNTKINNVKVPELMNKSIVFKRGFLIFEKIFKNNKKANRVTKTEQIYRMVLSKRSDLDLF